MGDIRFMENFYRQKVHPLRRPIHCLISFKTPFPVGLVEEKHFYSLVLKTLGMRVLHLRYNNDARHQIKYKCCVWFSSSIYDDNRFIRCEAKVSWIIVRAVADKNIIASTSCNHGTWMLLMGDNRKTRRKTLEAHERPTTLLTWGLIWDGAVLGVYPSNHSSHPSGRNLKNKK